MLRFYRDFIAKAPEEMGAFPAFQIAPPLPFIPEDRHGDTFIIDRGLLGRAATTKAEKALKPIREVAPIVAEFVAPMPYPALNSAFDALLPPGLQHYWKASFVNELSDGAIAAHLQHGPKIPTVNSTLHIYPDQRGRATACRSDATAFAYRDASFATVIAGMWPDPADNEANTDVGARLLRRDRPALGERAATSTSCPATTRTGSATTIGATTTAWRRSRGSTTRATCST